jgi:hypothetical protein
LSYGPDLSGGKVAMRAVEAALPYNDGGRATIAQAAKLGDGASESLVKFWKACEIWLSCTFAILSPRIARHFKSSELGNGGGNTAELPARRKITGGRQNCFAAEARFRYVDKRDSGM